MTATGSPDPGQHLYWLASRATGVTAFVLVAISVGLGLALSGRLVKLPGASAYLKTMHEASALTALAAIAAHGLLLLGDGYLHPGIAEILLPFRMHDQPAWTGLGVLGGWLAMVLGLSFYVRKQITIPVWRWLHRWTLAVYVLAVAHALGSGTDAGSTWLLALVATTAIPIVFTTTFKVLPGGHRRRRQMPPRGPASPRQAA